MKRILTSILVLTILAMPGNCSSVLAVGDLKSSTTSVQQQTDPATIYLPLISKKLNSTGNIRQNAIYLSDKTWEMPSSIFWFGKVTRFENYVDVRTGYTDTNVIIRFEVFDRLLWYDINPTRGELAQYDAISLYLRPAGVFGSSPDAGTYQFVAQSHPDYGMGTFHAEYRGNGSQWVATDVPYELSVGYQGEGGYNQTQNDNRGWVMTFKIPYSSLGLSGKPADSTTWGMAVTLHDRDDSNGPLAANNWPPDMIASQPFTWAELGFGLPTYTAPDIQNMKSISIRQDLNGAIVPDASVGGSTICGDGTEFFSQWGDTPESFYASSTVNNTQVNIQNQANVEDWPCFAKYYISFPMEAVPAGKVIRSAKLVMSLFGNSDPISAEGSVIHVMMAGSDWNESTLTWNNAPLSVENYAATFVDPLRNYPGDQGVTQEWMISAAVARAYRVGDPLRLILYSSDWSKHSGKYFFASNYSIAGSRPTLIITYGDPVP